jgi:transposase
MFLRATTRNKDGKEHRYWSIVENRRVGKKRVVQQTLLYLGEINDCQYASWTRAIEALESGKGRQVSLFPSDRDVPEGVPDAIQIRLSALTIRNPRQWGGCWLALELWDQLGLDDFWEERLEKSRKGTDWLLILKSLVVYYLLDPGSEWRLHRMWYEHSALRDLLNTNCKTIEKNTLYRCLDHVLPYKDALTEHLVGRWKALFNPSFDVLLYDLTSTYFESDPPFGEDSKRKFGYSRDKRSDCVQVVVALIVTPEGFPLSYEVLPGNTADNTTLRGFLKRIEERYGKARRIWVMDRGIPTEEVLTEMRASNVSYLVGTPKGRLTRLEKSFLNLPWEKVQGAVEVKLVDQDGEMFILARSKDRIAKERAIRKRRLKLLWRRLGEIKAQRKLTRDALQRKIGAAQKDAGRVAALVTIAIPDGAGRDEIKEFSFSIDRIKLRSYIRKEGHYLLRSNISLEKASELWQMYIQLTNVESAFRTLKSDLAIRPIFHQLDSRIDAHIFIVFIAYCLYVTLQHRSRATAPGLTARSILEQMKQLQMVDLTAPTTDGRWLRMSRFTQPNKTQALLLAQLQLPLPPQPKPHITHDLRLLH